MARPEANLTLPLPKPVKVSGGELTELRLQEPTTIQVWHAEGELKNGLTDLAQTRYARSLVARTCGLLKPEVLDDVPLPILDEAAAYLVGFVDLEFDRDALHAEHPDTWSMPIDPPIEHQGLTHSLLELRAPTVGEMSRAQSHLERGRTVQAVRSFQMWLVTNVSGVHHLVVQRLPVSQLVEAATYLGGFTGRGRATGQT